MVGERLEERRADTAAARLGQHARRERAEPAEVGASRDAGPGGLAVELGEQEQPLGRPEPPQLLD
jgi:hypothetical protein